MSFSKIYLFLLIILLPTGIYRSLYYVFPSNILFIIFFVLGILILLLNSNSKYIHSSVSRRIITLTIFLNLYLIFNSLIFSNIYGYDLLSKSIYGLLFLIITFLVLSNAQSFNDINLNNFLEKVILLSIFLSCSLIIYEAFYLGANFAGDLTAVQGRADGFFRNPNEAGRTLILVYALYNSIRQEKNSKLFYLTTFLITVSCFGTFSKGAISMLILTLILVYFLSNKLRLLPFFIIVGFSLFPYIFSSDFADLIGRNSFSRIENIFSENNIISATNRFTVLRYSLKLFIENPFFGAGLGTNISWNFGYASHNNFMFYATDTGIIGLLIITLIHTSLFNRVDMIFPIIFLVNSFFTHNTFMTSETYVMLAIYIYFISNTYQSDKIDSLNNNIS